jgi:hypothetical protein
LRYSSSILIRVENGVKSIPKQKLDDLAALMSDLGLPGSVVKMSDTKAQKALRDERKAGLNIML